MTFEEPPEEGGQQADSGLSELDRLDTLGDETWAPAVGESESIAEPVVIAQHPVGERPIIESSRHPVVYDLERAEAVATTESGEASIALRVAAGLLSAVVPGAGLFLRRRFADGLFVLIGCLVLFAIPVGIEMAAPKSVTSHLGLLYLVLWGVAALLYLGGIWASTMSNKAVRQARGASRPPIGSHGGPAGELPGHTGPDVPRARQGVVARSLGEQNERVTESLVWRIVVMFGGMALGWALWAGVVLLLNVVDASLWDSGAFLAVVVTGIVVAPVLGIWLLHVVMHRVFGLRVKLKILRPKEERDVAGALGAAVEREAVNAACSGCLLGMGAAVALVALLIVTLFA